MWVGALVHEVLVAVGEVLVLGAIGPLVGLLVMAVVEALVPRLMFTWWLLKRCRMWFTGPESSL